MLAAAAQLFGSNGFCRTTLDDVAARVGLAKPRLYAHFDSKQEMLKACVKRALCQWETVIHETQTSLLLPDGEAVGSFVEKYADVAFGDFGMCLMRGDVDHLDFEIQDELLRKKAYIDVRFKALIAKAIGRQSQSAIDAEFLWSTAAILVHGIAFLKCSTAEKRNTLSRALDAVLIGSNIKGR